MNIGLYLRAVREVVGVSLVIAAIVGAISGLLAYALPRIQERFLNRGFIPPGVRQFRDAIFGFDSSGAGIADVSFALAWSHPIVLALLSAHAITVCTRVPAGEVERGTADILFSMPAPRWTLLVSETLAWLSGAAMVLGAVYVGSYVGSRFIKAELRPNFERLGVVLANLSLVYLAIGAGAQLAATWTDRRVRAVLVVLVVTVFSLLINFLHSLDPALEFTRRLKVLSVLEYYKPIRVLMEGGARWGDMGVLAGAIVALWVGTLVRLTRRDITTT